RRIVTSVMLPAPDPLCIEDANMLDEYYHVVENHLIINSILCVFLMFYILTIHKLRDTYKLDLIPLLVFLLVFEGASACTNAIPYVHCYRGKYSWLFVDILWHSRSISYVLKQFHIMHVLIRKPLVERFSSRGMEFSILAPFILSLFPLYGFTFRYSSYQNMIIDYPSSRFLKAEIMLEICEFANFVVSMWWILSRRSYGSSFPVIVVVHSTLDAAPNALRIIMSGQHSIRIDEWEAYDLYVTFIVALVLLTLELWEQPVEKKKSLLNTTERII
ncbi:hypothetical protein PRIPAC_71048, partial [Pristionchus pacificus]|uniref:Uncharacterized protein n=1 Tax=Pristionchus pacificus TaxID=54126 RepID=A0A2A6C953_PRIPA